MTLAARARADGWSLQRCCNVAQAMRRSSFLGASSSAREGPLASSTGACPMTDHRCLRPIAIALIVGITIGWVARPHLGSRYFITHGDPHPILRLNTFTGQVWVLGTNGWKLAAEAD